VNRALDAQFGYTFQTRMKRVIEVRGSDEDGHPQTVRILFKSVGWGWLAYHGYLAGMRLKGDVPELIGLREGLLALEWVGPLDPALPAASEEACRAVVAEYVAQRTKTLRVPEDPWMAPGLSWRGMGPDAEEPALSTGNDLWQGCGTSFKARIARVRNAIPHSGGRQNEARELAGDAVAGGQVRFRTS